MALSEEKIKEIEEQLAGLSAEEQQKKLQEILATLTPEEREELTGGQCPFCLMVQGKIPVRKVYEDEVCLAILDINPANPGHTLLFPKKHYSVLGEIEDKEVGHLFIIANKIASLLFETMKAEGTNITVANGFAAGQRAPHVLINIIPRFSNDKVAINWQGKRASDEELDNALSKISSKPIVLKKPDIVVKRTEGKAKRDMRIA